AEDGIRDWSVTGVQTCALPIYPVSDANARANASRRLPRQRPAGLHGMQDAADLGREHEAVARLLAQRRAHAQLAAAVPVERRSKIGRASCREREEVAGGAGA